MPKFNLLRIPSAIIALAMLFVVLLTSHNDAGTPRDPLSLPAHIERGDRVARHYDLYSRQLAQYRSSLARALKETAPELLVQLQPREPLLHGYQILPRITPENGSAQSITASVAYSWPWTDHLIDEEQRRIRRAQEELGKAGTSAQGRAVLQRLAFDYHELGEQRRILDAHIQYNLLWQGAIAANRPAYDEATALHDEIFQHRKIIDRLARIRAMFEHSSIAYNGVERLAETTAGLRAREALLRRRIDQALGSVNTPGFVAILNSGDEWVVRVPLVTDIEDHKFVAAAKKIIERTWRLTGRDTVYRVELDVEFISADRLYGKQKKPVNGEKLDLQRHLKRFPPGAAILTTGARTTHVRDNAIILGPHDLSPRILAHEFGHILGFRDLYVRGYNDLGDDGFQVIEIVFDAADIMAATPQGRVLPGHFSRLIERAVKNSPRTLRPKLSPVRQVTES